MWPKRLDGSGLERPTKPEGKSRIYLVAADAELVGRVEAAGWGSDFNARRSVVAVLDGHLLGYLRARRGILTQTQGVHQFMNDEDLVMLRSVRPLFQTQAKGGVYAFDVAADNQRFLFNTTVEENAAASFTIVLNWPAGLQK